MIRLIVSDMDGTLLDGEGKIPEEFWDLVPELRKKNILFAVASGRQYYTLLEQFAPIRDDIIFIAENGTYVVWRGEELFANPLPLSDARDILRHVADLPGTQAVLCGKKSAYIQKGGILFEEEVRKYYFRLRAVEDLCAVEDEICKIALCNFDGSEKHIYPAVRHWADRYKIVVSGKVWLDVEKLDASKGTGVAMIQKKLGIGPDESMVFGDFLNDLEMMPLCKYSFAMENAHPDLKKAAAFLAPGNTEKGVITVIRQYI